MEANHILALVGAVTLLALAIVAIAGFVTVGVEIGKAIVSRLTK